MISSLEIVTFISVRGRGGGPLTLRPFKSYTPLWHAHHISPLSGRYCTVHARCEHVASNAFISPFAVFTTMAARCPNGKTFDVFTARSFALPTFTLETSTVSTG